MLVYCASIEVRTKLNERVKGFHVKRFAIEMTQEQTKTLVNLVRQELDNTEDIVEQQNLKSILLKIDLSAKDQLKKDIAESHQLA